MAEQTYGERNFPLTFSSMLGEWSRARLWVLYSCYLHYLFFPDIRVVFPLAFGYELVDFFVRLWTEQTKLENNKSASYIAFDISLRILSITVSIFLAIYIQYAFDLTPIQGLNGLGYMWFAWTFLVLRELTMYKSDYWIVVAHALLYGLLGDTLFFFEWENYVVLAVYIVVLLACLALTEYIGYVSFVIFILMGFGTSLIYNLAGPVDARPSFDTFLT